MAILDENEFIKVDGRSYLNPQIALDESNAFIDNLRSTQQSDNQKIQTDTYNLGTDISSNLGGLTSPVNGGNSDAGLSYFASRYQTPQTASAVANLRATAQAAALNQVLENEQATWKKRYQDAYNAYQKRSWNRGNNGGGSPKLDIDTNETDGNGTVKESIYTDGEYVSGKLYPVTDYVSDYQDANGKWWVVTAPTQVDTVVGPASNLSLYKKENENVVTANGRKYMYLDNVPNKEPAWYRVVESAGPNTYSPYAGD